VGGDLYIASPTDDEVLELRSADPGRLDVIAGTGSAGRVGNGGPAVLAQLDGPQGIAVDSAGDLYIADTDNCEVREVPSHNGLQWGIPMATARIYTVAGTGTCGETGDGGPNTSAEVWNPTDLAVGPSGDLLISDTGGEEILELAATSGKYYGVSIEADHVTPIAGIGSYGPYLVDGLPATGDTGELNSPAGIALDPAGDLFVCDTYSSAIREVPVTNTSERGVSMTAGDMYTVAGALGTGSGNQQTRWDKPEMLYPYGIAIASGGRLVYSDQGANVVREIPDGW
jgi:sugar lactone lactonase YvrE